MPKRKTVRVEDLVDTANRLFKNSTCEPAVRQGVINFLEHFLHETGNYQGFRYLLQDEVPAGEKPGVNYLDGLPHPDYHQRFDDTDRTRVQY